MKLMDRRTVRRAYITRGNIPVGLGIEPRHGAVMMQRTDSVERTATAPDLLHLARQRNRVGRVISAGQREHAPRKERAVHGER